MSGIEAKYWEEYVSDIADCEEIPMTKDQLDRAVDLLYANLWLWEAIGDAVRDAIDQATGKEEEK